MPYKDINKKREYSRKYYQEHKDYYQTKSHKNKKRLYDKKYRQLKRNQIRKYHKKYTNQKRKIDINFKLATYLRNRIYCALKRNIKSNSTMNLLGCNIEFLKRYLANKFQLGMNWNNYGLWEIDHIRPCASFDLSKENEQRECFNYTNLQPLWKTVNRIKHVNYAVDLAGKE
jgi:hypothetical protein